MLASAAINALMIPVTEDLPPDQWTVWIWRGTEEPEKGYLAGGNWLSLETGMPVIVRDLLPEAMTGDEAGPDAWALILALSAWERAQRKPCGNS